MQLFRALIALTVLGASAASLAEETPSRNLFPSNLLFSIDGADLGIFPIVVEDGDNVAISYQYGAGRIHLSLGLPRNGRYQDPLFCFNQLAGNNAVALQARDPNGHLTLDGIPLSSNLSYILGNNELRYLPAPSVQCFYRGDSSGEFGLFGRPPLISEQFPGDRFFTDRFEADERVSIEYANLASFRNPGQPLNYQIILRNEGTSNLSQVAFQELAPTAAALFDSSVTPVTADFWSCVPSGGATCPTTSEDLNSLRFRGLSLPVGSSMTFSLNRAVRSSSEAGTLIDLHAGVVVGSGNAAAFDTASEAVVVIGSADSVFASPVEVAAGQTAEIQVTVLDSGNNPVPFVDVDLVNDDGLTITPESAQTSDVSGYASFQASATEAGSYAPQFQVNGAGTALASVTVIAAAPDSVDAQATVAQAVADGEDEVVFTVLVEDEFGNPVSASLVEVIDANGLGGIASDDPFTNSDGVAFFTATSTQAGSYTVSFASGPATPDTATVDFLAGEPVEITFAQQPSNVPAGQVMLPPVIIHIADAQGNLVTDDNSSLVQIWLFQKGNVLDFNFAVASAIEGEVVFDNLSLDDPGEGYSLFAQAALSGGNAANQMSASFEVLDIP